MIARLTYDPTEIDLGRDEYFDYHFSSSGEMADWANRRSTGLWDGHLPSETLLVENFGVTHEIKPWDPNLFVEDITKPTRLPASPTILCRKAKCRENSKKVGEREYLAPLDPRYVTRFICGNEGGNGGPGFPHHGGGGGGSGGSSGHGGDHDGEGDGNDHGNEGDDDVMCGKELRGW